MVNALTTTKKPRPITAHSPLLHHPWFADSSEGVTLHRYFDDQFIPRFVQEAVSGRLIPSRAQDWYNSDRFGRKDMPTLRLPMHQTFYVVCCEVSCDNPGLPAYSPARIGSSGFVVRRRTASGEVQRWMLSEGQALGWQGGVIPDQEPDDYRRFVNRKLIAPQYPEPAYSGEESHPLHSLLVHGKEKSGKRSHTLLWGYLPLGGTYRIDSSGTQPPAEATQALAGELAWPFGERNARSWAKQDNRPVFQGRASVAFYELLELLLMRYRVFDKDDPDNHELRRQIGEIHFYPSLVPHPPHPPQPHDPYATPPANTRGESLLAWIETSRDALLEWLSNIATGKTSIATSLLPRTPQSTGGTAIRFRSDDLYLGATQAHTLRDTLLLRGGRAMVQQENGLAMPRFGQSDDDSFFIVPFVRWQDECGCERIVWGSQTSIGFRVVSPLDPEAQRPRAVVLPGLDDLKRGAAKGVSLLAPKSLADVLRKIKPTMDMGGGGPGNPSGLCWSFSLSIPVVTICAMILLMVLINLLNIIFFWLPWAILALPRLCGKLLSENK